MPTYPNPSGTQQGLFVPTTNVWDTSQIYSTDVTSPEFKELLVRLYQNINNIAIAVNLKDSGYYDTQEFVNGQSFFPNPALNSSSFATPDYRPDFRIVVIFGALPNAATKSVAHGLTITSGYSFTRIYGTATDPVGLTAIPLTNPGITLSVSSTNVIVTTTSNLSNYTITYVVLEYLKW